MERYVMPIKKEGREKEEYEWPDLEVRLSQNPKAGFGLYAKTSLHKNTFIPYYGTEVKRKLVKSDDDNVYLVEIEPNFYIDGSPENRDVSTGTVRLGENGKSIAAMANEPARGHMANAVLVTMGERHQVTGAFVHLITTRRIRRGEEITADYNFNEDAPPRSYSKGLAAIW